MLSGSRVVTCIQAILEQKLGYLAQYIIFIIRKCNNNSSSRWSLIQQEHARQQLPCKYNAHKQKPHCVIGDLKMTG